MQTLDRDWYGKPCPHAHFEVINTVDWVFRVYVEHPPEQSFLAAPGDYAEGLWEQNVAEWFIVNPLSGRYVECNLAANGAWWMMVFSAPRVRDERRWLCMQADKKTVSTQCVTSSKDWQAELIIPASFLLKLLGGSDWAHNVCFILGQQPRQYISLNTLHAADPDFHRPQDFITRLW